jgi:hypothetical protein
MSDMKGKYIEYRVVHGKVCYWIKTDSSGMIVDAAPIARAWCGKYLSVFKKAFPFASVRELRADV